MIWYGILLALAIVLNMRDQRMVAVTCVVGFGIFVPIPDAFFYLICACVEVIVAGLATAIDARASKPITRISVLLVIFHGMGWVLNGYPPESPYHIMVKVCEYAELVTCIILSQPFKTRSDNGL